MFKSQKSLRFIVVILAVTSFSALAIAANWGTSYGFNVFESRETAIPDRDPQFSKPPTGILAWLMGAEKDSSDRTGQVREGVAELNGRLTEEPSRFSQVVSIQSLGDDRTIDMAALGIHPTQGRIEPRIPSGNHDGVALGTGNAVLGITHEVVNQNTANAFGTLSSGWTLGEPVQFYLNGTLAGTFAASATTGNLAVGINTGAGFGYITIDQIGQTSGRETGGVVQVAPTGPYLPGVTGAPHAVNTTAAGQVQLYGWGYPVSTTNVVTLYRNGVSLGFVTTSAAGRFNVLVTPANNGDTSAVYSADRNDVPAGSMAGVSIEERSDAGTPPVGDRNAARVLFDRATLNSATGGTVAIVGEGFQAGETVTVSSCASGSLTASANGAAFAFLNYGAGAGVSQCVLTGATSGRIGRGTVLLHANVTNLRGLIVAPPFVSAGGTVTVMATKLPANDTGNIYLDGVLQGTATTGATGSGTFTLTKPTFGIVHEVGWIATTGTGDAQSTVLLLTPGSCDYAYTVSTGATITAGTDDTGNHCDDCSATVALPFSYTLYDQTFASVAVGSNGHLTFGTVNNGFGVSCIPISGATYAVGPYWGDQCTDNANAFGCGGTAASGIFTSTSGTAPNRIFNIEYRTTYFGDTQPLDYEVRLYEGQTAFDVIYGAVPAKPTANDSSLSAGVQRDNTAGNFTVAGCDPTGGQAPPVTAGQRYHYTLVPCVPPTPTPTPTPATPTPTPTPTPATPTPTPFPTPSPGCTATYSITTTTGNAIVPGTVDTGNHADDGTTAIALPFPVSFYGTSYSNANVDSNGTFQFTSNSSFFSNSCLPSASFNNAIFPHWDDLYTVDAAGGQGIFTATTGSAPNRNFIIEWRAQFCCASGTPVVNFEIIFHEGSPNFDVIYGNVSGNGVSATIGVQQGTGSSFTQFSCNSASLSTGLMTTYNYGIVCPTPTPTPTPMTPTPSPTPTASPCAPVVLYDQTDSPGTNSTVSQNFEPANDAFDNQGADDFVVPGGQTWSINQVNATGVYFNGPGPAASFNVTFYQNSGTVPGAAVGGTCTAAAVPFTQNASVFQINLPSACVLAPGTYWVSVQANLNFTPGGEWGWTDRSVQSNSPAAWQNPGGGFGTPCTTWGARGAGCGIDNGVPDQIFQILGRIAGGGCATPFPTPSVVPTPTTSPTPTPMCPNYTLTDGTGTLVPATTDIGNHCDDCNTSVALPFPVTFYGTQYNSALAGSNGYLSLGAPYNFFYSGCLPNANFTYTIFPFAVDQITGATGNYGIFTLTTGTAPNRTFYIEWRACRYNGATTCLANTDDNYEVAFYEGASFFDIFYGTFGSANASVGAIGVQGATTAIYTQSQCNAGRPASNQQRYTQLPVCPTPTPTPTPTVTPTPTPSVQPTPTVTPTPTPSPCNYTVTTTSGAAIVAGVTDTGNHCDDCTTAVALPFPVSFYGQTFSTANVDSNGTLQFVSSVSSFSNTALPNASFNMAIFPFWDDQNTTAGLSGCVNYTNGCGIFTVVTGTAPNRIFNIEWHAVQFSNNANTANYEVQLLEGSSTFTVIYGASLGNATYTGTIGAQRDTGSAFTQVAGPSAVMPATGTQYSFTIAGCPTPTPVVTPTPATPTPPATPSPVPTPTCVVGGGGAWTVVAPYPGGTIEGSAVASDGVYAYNLGGFVNLAASNLVHRYDPVANAWTPLAPMPATVYAARAAYSSGNNSAYVFGGYNGSAVVSTAYRYDIASNTWTTVAAMPAARIWPEVAYYAATNKFYVIGGLDSSFIEQSQTWEYNPLTNTWDTTRANAPVGEGSSSLAASGQFLYLMGGYGGGAGTADHYRYDIVANAWTALAPLPLPNRMAAPGNVAGKNYFTGGGQPSAPGGATSAPGNESPDVPAVNSNTYIYDIASNTWSTGPSTNSPHAWTNGAAIGSRLIIVGGYDGTTGDTTVVEVLNAAARVSVADTERPADADANADADGIAVCSGGPL